MQINNENNYSNVAKDISQTDASNKVSTNHEQLPQKGDVIKGEITDVFDKSISIKLPSGETVNAKVMDQFEFNIGDNLSFQVKDSNTNQLILTPIIEEGNALEAKLSDILKNAGLTVNTNNLNVLEKLLANNLPADNANLSKMITYSKQFRDTSVDTLIFMSKNEIPINSENIEQLELMTSGENKIVKNLATISDELSGIINKASGGEVANIIFGDNSLALDTITQLNQQTSQINLSNPETSDMIEGEVPTDTASKQIQLSSILSQETIDTLKSDIGLMINKAVPDGDISNLMGAKTIEELFSAINEMGLENESKEGITNLISKNISYGLILNEVLMNEEDLDSPTKLNDFYNNLHNKIKSVLSLDELGVNKETSEVYNEASNVKNAIEFMDDLGNNFTYVGLPIMLEDKVLNSELYILNNKRQLKSKNQSITALVRLDLVNLGHLDIYVKKAGNDVDCTFYTESSEKTGLLEGHTVKLNNTLSQAGFNVRGMSVTQNEKKIDMLDQLMDNKESDTQLKRYSFDMRA